MPSKLAALAANPPARTARRLTRFTVIPPIDLSPERNKHSTELCTPPASNLPGSTMLASADGRNGAKPEAAGLEQELPLSAERGPATSHCVQAPEHDPKADLKSRVASNIPSDQAPCSGNTRCSGGSCRR